MPESLQAMSSVTSPAPAPLGAAPAMPNIKVSDGKNLAKLNAVRFGSDPSGVLEAVEGIFGAHLTTPGIIYSLHFGYLPPEWGYTSSNTTITARNIAESVVSYRQSVSLYYRMCDTIDRRESLEPQNSYFRRFDRTLAKSAVIMITQANEGLPEGFRVLTDREDTKVSSISTHLATIDVWLPHTVMLGPPDEHNRDEYGSDPTDFVAFAGRFDAFVTGFRAVMAAVPPLGTKDAKLRAEWDSVFLLSPEIYTLPVTDKPTASVVEGVHMLTVPIPDPNPDGDTYKNVFDDIEQKFPGKLRKWAGGVVQRDITKRELTFDVPHNKDSASFTYEAKLTKDIDLGFQALHDDVGNKRFGDYKRIAKPQLFVYISTQHEGQLQYTVQTSAVAQHPYTPSYTAMLEADADDFAKGALFTPTPEDSLAKRGANRWCSLMASRLHAPRGPLAQTSALMPHMVAVICFPDKMAHGSPILPEEYEIVKRNTARVGGFF